MTDAAWYESVGGDAFFLRLVDAFYDAIERDELIRPMYPDDLTDAKRHLALFLMQYWGGPATYLEERGHPRLRMRHQPYRITKRHRDAWLAAMRAALATVGGDLTTAQRTDLDGYFEMAARSLRNV